MKGCALGLALKEEARHRKTKALYFPKFCSARFLAQVGNVHGVIDAVDFDYLV